MLLFSSLFLVWVPFDFSNDTAHAATTQYVNAKSDIILRDAPNKNAKQLSKIKNHTSVSVISESNGWSYIQSGKLKGYVYTSALTKKNPKKSTATIVTGGLMPKVGLKLTYDEEFISSGKVTYEIKNNADNSVFFYDASGRKSYYFAENEKWISFGVADANWEFFYMEYPIKQGTIVNYEGPHIYAPGVQKITVESTTKTIKVKAGTFKNVVIFKYPNDVRYYLAKGIGIIKIGYPDGTSTELLSVK